MTQAIRPRPAGAGHRWTNGSCEKCGKTGKVRPVERFNFTHFRLCSAHARVMEVLPITRRFLGNI